MQRIIKADDVSEAFREEGFDEAVSDMVQRNKSFRATRSLRRKGDTADNPAQVDKMSHGQSTN